MSRGRTMRGATMRGRGKLNPRPYSPETLADRWGCSAEKVRLMYHDSELAGFRLGKLIRIPAAEVDRYECQSLTPLPDTEDDTPLPSEKMESLAESRLARLTGDARRLSPVNGGPGITPQRANG